VGSSRSVSENSGNPIGAHVEGKSGPAGPDSEAESAPLCKICGLSSTPFGQAAVLRKYPVRYYRCEGCGFIQTESPYWLEEAYTTAIARQDVGIMQRNLANCEVTTAVLNLLFPDLTCAVDFGAGHGVFVRLMRDRGFNFSWCDRYATNDYARGFEHREGTRYGLLTAFEVLEHLSDPVSDLAPLMELSDNVFVSTWLVPEPAPGLPDWWYYSPTTGQHIALYTPSALQRLAAHFGRSLLSHGSYHLFTKQPKSNLRFQAATRFRLARLVNRMHRRPSLVEDDYRLMTG
jgi:hypothetical protein